MLTSKQILDQLAEKLGDASDYAIAAKLGVPRGTVSRWRVGKGTIGEDNAIVIAELLGEDPKFILSCVLSERSTSKKAKQILRQIADSFKNAAAGATLGIVFISSAFLSPTADAPTHTFVVSVYYV